MISNVLDRKLIFIIPSLQAGGMERVMSQLLDEFAIKKNVQLHLILYGIKREVFYPIPNSIVIHKPDFVFNNKYRFYYTLKTFLFLRKKIKKIKPSTILSFGELWNSFVLLSLFGLQCPVYVSDRCQPDKSLGKIHTLLRKWLYPKARGLIAQTVRAKEIYAKQFKHYNISVIGNPIRSVTFIQPVRRENIILSVGRLIDSKHHNRLIQLFAELNLSNWKLIIVGGDVIKQKNKMKLQLQIDALKLTNRVILTDTVSDVESYYLRSKIFAFTSSSEGFPNVIGEALSAGLPVVSYNCVAGPSDMIVNGENGFLVDVFDDKVFKQKILYLIKNAEIRQEMSINAAKSIQRFDSAIIAKKYFEFITSHLN